MAREKLTREELKNEMLLRTDIEGRTAWQLAACGGKADVLRGIYEMAKRN
jgi:hypothetical protein